MEYKIPIYPKVSSLFVCEKCGCSKIAIEFFGWQCEQGEHKFIEMIKVMSGVWR